MDRAAIRARARTISGIEMETLRSDSDFNSVINEFYQELLDAEPWPFLEAVGTITTVAGTSDYFLPEGVRRARTVTLESSNGPSELVEVTQSWLDRSIDGSSHGEPLAYARTGSGLTLAPTPGQVYTIQVRGYSSATTLSADSDEPLFDVSYHPAVAYGAAAVILSEEGQHERAEQAMVRAGTFLERMRDEYMKSHDDAPVVMGRGRSARMPTTSGRLWPWRR